MLVSAIIVTLLLMTTAATMTDIQEGQYEPMKQGYHIDSVRQLGNELDLGKKSDRQKFKTSLQYITSYSLDFSYWEQERCYNVTLSNSKSELRMKCVGNGSVFHDSFEDGEYKDPTWIKETGAGKAQVQTTYGPETGNKALLLAQNQSGQNLRIRWEKHTDIWNQRWKAEGLFHTEDLNTSTTQEHSILLYYDENTGNTGLTLELGFSDSSGETPATINAPGGTSTGSVDWQKDTWYRWELTHDGTGTYEAYIWPEDSSKPGSPTVQVTGNSLGSQARSGAIQISGSNGEAFTVLHDYLKLQEQ